MFEPWFIPTQGNHEMLMWKSLLEQDNQYINCWLMNGGEWFQHEPVPQLKFISEYMKKLPLIISVGNNNDRFNVVHAEILRFNNAKVIPVTNDDIDKWQFSDTDINNMLWGRYIIGMHTNDRTYKLEQSPVPTTKFQSDDLSITFCGHSVVPGEPIKIQRQIYIDTGCVNGTKPKNRYHQSKYPLTIACPKEQVCYSYDNHTNNLTTIPFSNIVEYKYHATNKL
jgi:hypothetical protein